MERKNNDKQRRLPLNVMKYMKNKNYDWVQIVQEQQVGIDTNEYKIIVTS